MRSAPNAASRPSPPPFPPFQRGMPRAGVSAAFYRPCHNNEKWVCANRARRATSDTIKCENKGPPGTAVEIGDCVIRLMRRKYFNDVALIRQC